MNNADKVYKQMLHDELNKINRKINELEINNQGIKALTNITTTEIESLKLQAENLKTQIANFVERQELGAVSETFVETFDEIVGINNEKRENVSANIEELRQLRNRLTTKRAIKKIDKKIDQQQKVLERLQKSDVRISNIQRAFMAPKHFIESKKQKILFNAQAKVNVAESNYNDIQELQAMLNPEASIKDSIMNVVYEIKGNYYLKKSNHSSEVLEQIQNSKNIVAMQGANAIVISKKLSNSLKNKLKMEQIRKDMNQTNPTLQNQQPILAVNK